MRVGVFGTGYLGRLHARILTEMPEASVVGFVEPKDDVADEVSTALKIKRFDDVAALAKEIDCAVVATPTTMHCEVGAALIEAGCDVMIEKPIADSIDNAQRLIDLAKKHGRIVQAATSSATTPPSPPWRRCCATSATSRPSASASSSGARSTSTSSST